MTFWIIIALVALVVAAFLLLGLRGGDTGDAQSGAASDVAVYRDQLDEIDRDLARGVLAPEDADTVRLEVSRRLLAADKRMTEAGGLRTSNSRGVAAAVVIATIIGGVALYTVIGAPGYVDQPLAGRLAASEEIRANRPTQEVAENAATALRLPTEADPDFLDLMTKLREAVEDRPEDAQGLMLLARNEARLGNYAAARRAQAQLIDVKGDDATPADIAALLDITVLAAGGVVTSEADTLIVRLAGMQPGNGTAAYYAGLGEAQIGRADRAVAIWRRLWEESPDGAPWLEVLRIELPRLAREAGVRFELPERRGPSAEDIAAASEMTSGDRAAMIRSMVDGLSDRLATEGGTAAEWARLITALGVLGEVERARLIGEEAVQVFASDDASLARVNSAIDSLPQ